MKKTLLFFLGIVCTAGFYSCSKNFVDVDKDTGEALLGRRNDCGCGGPREETNIYDPTCLVSPSAHGQLDTLATGFSFTEGPAVDRHGNIFFTDQPNDKIYKWSVNSKSITTFLTGTGRSNGMAFDKNGFLITCADMHGEIWKIAWNGSHTVLINHYD